MEVALSLLSLTFEKFVEFSGLLSPRNDLKKKKMEEKALEVYGKKQQQASTPGLTGATSTLMEL